MGVVLTKQGRFTEALTEYEAALEREPRFFPALHNIGSLNLLLGNTEVALAQFKAALERLKQDPNFDPKMLEDKELRVSGNVL